MDGTPAPQLVRASEDDAGERASKRLKVDDSSSLTSEAKSLPVLDIDVKDNVLGDGDKSSPLKDIAKAKVSAGVFAETTTSHVEVATTSDPAEKTNFKPQLGNGLSQQINTAEDLSSAVANTDAPAIRDTQPATSMSVDLQKEIGSSDSVSQAEGRSSDVTMADAPAAQPISTGSPAAAESKRDTRGYGNGCAPVKAEYLLQVKSSDSRTDAAVNDDAAEGGGVSRDAGNNRDGKGKKQFKGQNKHRSYGHFDDAVKLCNSRAYSSEFSPGQCRFGDRCTLSHNLREYLEDGRRSDVETFEGKCPVFEKYGKCPSGWKCRFVKSHMKEIEHDDGRKELVLVNKKSDHKEDGNLNVEADDHRHDVFNVVDADIKLSLSRRRVDFAATEQFITWLNKDAQVGEELHNRRNKQIIGDNADIRAQYTEPPLKPSEKRRLYFGRETPALAPLTTQGNLPFRRLCVELGAELTYSEMAMGRPLIQGVKADWTLMKAHASEIAPPKFEPNSPTIVKDYDNARDLRFGAQVSGHAPWIVVKSADILKRFVPHLRLIDLNCGCPIDMVYKAGGGSGLLESQGKLERMVRGMNAVSGEIPITVKLRTGVKQNRPTATQILGKLAFGSRELRDRLGAPGCAAITLHGRSREQRYTKKADWTYIAECAVMIKAYNAQRDKLVDTIQEPDESTLPNTKDGRMWFLGNGDCYSHVEYFEHIDKAKVDTVMVGRGALVKPWLFEEIEKGQYLDKSASERLTYIEKFVRYGLEAWGSDELGLGFTRRFLLEWLSFSHRYVPVGLLEVLPPNLNDRPPAYRGRNELETLLASPNYKDWIKISEMFLGPAHPGFEFQPKHKSNAYEAEG